MMQFLGKTPKQCHKGGGTRLSPNPLMQGPRESSQDPSPSDQSPAPRLSPAALSFLELG